jgi:hypothetical protein
MSNKPATSVERWNRAVRVAFEVGPEDLADEVLAKSDAEVDAELRAAGVDLDAFDEEGDALYARLLAAHESAAHESHSEVSERGSEAWTSEAPPKVVRLHARRRNAALLAVAAVAAASAAGAAYLGSQHEEEKREKPAPVPSASAALPTVPTMKQAPSATPAETKAAPREPSNGGKAPR